MTKHDHENDPFASRHAHDVGQHHAQSTKGEPRSDRGPFEAPKPGVKKTEAPAPAPVGPPKPAELVTTWLERARDQHTPSDQKQMYALCAAALADSLKHHKIG